MLTYTAEEVGTVSECMEVLEDFLKGPTHLGNVRQLSTRVSISSSHGRRKPQPAADLQAEIGYFCFIVNTGSTVLLLVFAMTITFTIILHQ